LVSHLASKGIDVNTLLSWQDPIMELNHVGIRQYGLVNKIFYFIQKSKTEMNYSKAFKKLQMSSVYERNGKDLNELGKIILDQGEQAFSSGESSTAVIISVEGHLMRFNCKFSIKRA